MKVDSALSKRTHRGGRCGAVIDRDLNAAANLASLMEATGTASGVKTGRDTVPANVQREERIMDLAQGAPRRAARTAAPLRRDAGIGSHRHHPTCGSEARPLRRRQMGRTSERRSEST